MNTTSVINTRGQRVHSTSPITVSPVVSSLQVLDTGLLLRLVIHVLRQERGLKIRS